jgi:hypothetical protein
MSELHQFGDSALGICRFRALAVFYDGKDSQIYRRHPRECLTQNFATFDLVFIIDAKTGQQRAHHSAGLPDNISASSHTGVV